MKRFALIFLLATAVFGVAFAQYSTLVYFPQGGSSLEVASGGAINVASGGAATVASGATLTGAGTNNLTGSTTLGANGTALTTLRIVTVTVASGQTSGTAAGTGLTASSKVVGCATSAATSNACYVRHAKCETGAVDVVVNTDPGVSTAIVNLLIAN